MILKIFSKNKKVVLAGIVFLLSLFFYSNSALAQTTYNALVTIPGIPPGAKVQVYLSGLYTFLISVVGIVAMGAIVIGGARYLTSAGNPSAIEDAKHTINSAIYGLLLAITSWVIINTINPDILVLKNPAMPWSAVGYSPTGPTPQCALAGGDGTTNAPCSCIDDPTKPIYGVGASGTKTNLTLTVVPDTIGNALATTVVLSGKLTDINGVSLSGKTIKINWIAPLLFASNTYTAVTNISGDYTWSINFPAGGKGTGIGGDIMQAVFTGTTTAPLYAGVGSNTVVFTRNSASGTYTSGDYQEPAGPGEVATLWTAGGNICNAICSNKNLATDGNYHCLKVNVKKGWVADISGYTPDQLRAMATSATSQTNPFVSHDGDYVIVEVERASTVLNTPAIYTFDSNGDMVCEPASAFLGWYRAISEYIASDGGLLACNLTASPKAETCSIKFCVTDSQGNEADALLYYTILAP